MLSYWWHVGLSVFVTWPLGKKKAYRTLNRDPTTTADPHQFRCMFTKRCRSIHSLACTLYCVVYHPRFSRIFGAGSLQSGQEMGRHTKTRALLHHSLVSGSMKEAAGISRFVSLRSKSQRSLTDRHLFVYFKSYFLPQAINALWFIWDLEDFNHALWNPVVWFWS